MDDETRQTEKAANYGARAGQTIAGNLRRGNDGRFSSGGSGATSQPESKRVRGLRSKLDKLRQSSQPKARRAATSTRTRQAPLGREAKPRLTAEERARERLIKQQQRVDELARRRSIRLQQRNDAKKKREAERLQKAEAAKPTTRQGRLDRLQQQMERRQSGGSGSRGGGSGRGGKPGVSPQLRDLVARYASGDALSEQDARALVRAGLAYETRGGALRLSAAARRALTSKEHGSLTVYKSADGTPRWIAITTTNFLDRDREYISEQAIKADIERSYKEQNHGPLRFWHVGTLSGGLDIGDCDFRLWHGHSLIESGTFRKKEYADLIKPGDQMSPGFIHPPSEPGGDRTYWHIRIFERSVTPRGRAANPYTLITTAKEHDMSAIAPEKLAEFQERGGDPALLESLIAQQETKEKSIETATTFKSDEPEQAVEAAPEPEPEQAAEATEKAAAAPAAPMAEKPEVEVEVEQPEGEGGEELYVGDMYPEELAALIEEKMAPLMESVAQALAMDQKMTELKSMLGGYVARKDDEAAQLREQMAQQQTALEQLATRLKELEGDVPAGVGYRASQSAPVPERLKDAPRPQGAPLISFFDSITRSTTGSSGGLED